MRIRLHTLLAFCPFLLNSLYAEEDQQDEEYFLEEEIADEEKGVQPYSLDEIADQDDSDEDSSSMGQENEHPMQTSQGECYSPFHKAHVGVRHIEARGIGYRSGYTTLEGFGIYDRHNHFMPFLDLRGHVFDDGKFAGNVGIGERTALFSINHFLGIYCYYDVRQDRHGLTVNQIGPGIELVGSRMEYRINGYFPVGNTKSHKYDFDFDKFKGHRIITKAKQRETLTGGDAEVGVHITQSTKYDLYAAAGAYYFSASDVSSWGGRTKLTGRYKEYISLEVSYSYDHLFHSIVQGSVGFNVPFGGKLKRRHENCGGDRGLWFSRAAFAPQRFEIPVIKKVTHRSKAINPATKKPWQVWFVNNTSHSNGTYESPFSTLAQAQNASSANDMIYVFPGDGTTNGMKNGITLKAGQSFLGSGISQTIATTKGKLKIPHFTSSNPTITNTNTALDVVDLNNGNVVSGFNIVTVNSSTGNAIGTPTSLSSINGATIKNNTITIALAGSTSNAILLNASGTININNNTISSGPTILNNGVTITQQGSVQVNIWDNTVSGFNFSLSIPANSTVQNNTISQFSSTGIALSAPSSGQLAIKNNTISSTVATAGFGINVQSTTLVSIMNNQVSVPTGATGITVDSTSLPSGSTCRAILSGNNVSVASGGGGIGILLNSSSGNGICASITGNQVAIGPAAAFQFTGSTGKINIDTLEDNIGSPVSSSGNVFFVPEGSCGP